MLLLLTPGVWYIGCAYAIATQAYVLACVMLSVGSIETAARLNMAAAVANALLSIILWRSISNIMDVGLAAFRAGIVCAVSLTMVISSQNLVYNSGAGQPDSPLGNADTGVRVLREPLAPGIASNTSVLSDVARKQQPSMLDPGLRRRDSTARATALASRNAVDGTAPARDPVIA